MERKKGITMKKPTKEQIKDLLLIIAVICLFKIAFFGTTTTLKTERRGININSSVSGDITVDTIFPLRVNVENP